MGSAHEFKNQGFNGLAFCMIISQGEPTVKQICFDPPTEDLL
jgi:hypothetical protein